MSQAIYFRKWKSPLGNLFFYSDKSHLLAVTFTANRQSVIRQLKITKPLNEPSKVIELAIIELSEYFEGKRKKFSVPLKMNGTVFQKQVWSSLTKISYAKKISYKDQAAILKNEKAFRAIGSANGKNPISIIIPCHRVVASSGSLAGYAGGLKNKLSLLNLEKNS